jgi:hypothetical protein
MDAKRRLSRLENERRRRQAQRKRAQRARQSPEPVDVDALWAGVVETAHSEPPADEPSPPGGISKMERYRALSTLYQYLEGQHNG